MLLPITLTMAGAAAIINVWLASRCVRSRITAKVLIGDGGDPGLIARMRAHANFVEYTPFFLILLGLIEYARGPRLWLWVAAILFLVARIAHAFGMDRTTPNALRGLGMMLSITVLIVFAGYAIYLPYAG